MMVDGGRYCPLGRLSPEDETTRGMRVGLAMLRRRPSLMTPER